MMIENNNAWRLDELAKLHENWDSYGASPISGAAIKTARVIACTTPHVVPRASGGIQIEWVDDEGRCVEIEIDPDGSVDGSLAKRSWYGRR